MLWLKYILLDFNRQVMQKMYSFLHSTVVKVGKKLVMKLDLQNKYYEFVTFILLYLCPLFRVSTFI